MENLIELGSESEIFGLDEIAVRENVGWFAHLSLLRLAYLRQFIFAFHTRLDEFHRL